MRLARSNVRLLVLIAFYFLFIVIGASIFSTIEAPHENSVIRKLRAKRAAFLEEHPCVKAKIDTAELKRLPTATKKCPGVACTCVACEFVVAAGVQGVPLLSRDHSKGVIWAIVGRYLPFVVMATMCEPYM
ncbi:hypothetical protein HPB50_015914 [Hyalomma asiaticum]|uniref:Uncharacterized protein n=1 Tax=Hyalomma asiaticum TaxID=266040 RepID=A0ACB7RXP7_HYAAI|nr:hypothetical protein HPB50_015914 [Hyalomma asiaticum]